MQEEDGKVFQLGLCSGSSGSGCVHGASAVDVAATTSAAVGAALLPCWHHGSAHAFGLLAFRGESERRRLLGVGRTERRRSERTWSPPAFCCYSREWKVRDRLLLIGFVVAFMLVGFLAGIGASWLFFFWEKCLYKKCQIRKKGENRNGKAFLTDSLNI